MGALAALLLPVGVLLGFATPAAAATHDVHTVKELADAFADAEDGDTVRIAADIVGENDSPDVEVPADIAVTLDLNRHSVTLIGTERGPSSLDPTNNPGIWVPPTSGLTIIATGGERLTRKEAGTPRASGGSSGLTKVLLEQ